MMVVVVRAETRLLQVLGRGKLSGLGRVLELRGELVELAGLGRVAIGLRLLGLLLEAGRNVRNHLLELVGILLLELLEQAQELGQRRDLGGPAGCAAADVWFVLVELAALLGCNCVQLGKRLETALIFMPGLEARRLPERRP